MISAGKHWSLNTESRHNANFVVIATGGCHHGGTQFSAMYDFEWSSGIGVHNQSVVDYGAISQTATQPHNRNRQDTYRGYPAIRALSAMR